MPTEPHDFEPQFHSRLMSCYLWADVPAHGRVRFEIPCLVMEDVLGGGNTVNDDANVLLCEREPTRIERACRRAFAERPGGRIVVQPQHFC